jgi:nucleoside-diphosphate-sugar epimerase
MTVLVLGSSGLVGRKLTRRLLDEGHTVVAGDVAPPSEAVRDETEGAVHVRADMARLDQVLGVVKEHGVTRIALLSYIMGPLMSPAHTEILGALEVNVTGVTNVLEAARLSDARRVVFLSTVGTYGPPELYGDRPVNEDDILAPASMYGRMKALNESVADRYASPRAAPSGPPGCWSGWPWGSRAWCRTRRTRATTSSPRRIWPYCWRACSPASRRSTAPTSAPRTTSR